MVANVKSLEEIDANGVRTTAVKLYGQDSDGNSVPQDYVGGAAKVYDTAIPPGGDIDNDVTVVEQGRYVLQRSFAVGEFTFGATGAVGDYLESIILPRGLPAAATGNLVLKDGGGTAMLFGADSVGIAPGQVIPIKAVSQVGAWSLNVQTGSANEVCVVGIFT